MFFSPIYVVKKNSTSEDLLLFGEIVVFFWKFEGFTFLFWEFLYF